MPNHCRCLLLALTVSWAHATPAIAGQAAAEISPEQLQASIREIGGSVARIRGLKFKTPVSMETIDGATARESFKAKIETSTVEQARHAQNAYVQLGLVPQGTDLIKNYLDQAEKDVLGYYDTRSKRLYLLSHVAPDEVRGVLAHELTHALDDQHYDLLALGQKAHGDDDHATAITAVIEGSAMVVMAIFVHDDSKQEKAVKQTTDREQKRAVRLQGAPSFVQQTVMLPYLLGFSFLLRGKPWNIADGLPAADFQEAFTNPPRSTTQVLHPEQYWGGRWRKELAAPTLPDLSKALGAGWSRVLEGSIGELGLAVLTGSKLNVGSIQALLPSRWTHEAAAGTTGDVFHHYVNGDRSTTVLLVRWETRLDAEQFDRALLSRGKYFVRYGVHTLVFGGYVDPGSIEAIANAALQGLSYW